MPKILVASAMVPKTPEHFKAMCECIVSDNEPGQMEVKGLVLIDGPGCLNIVVLVEGSDWENWTNQFTNQMHGKWERLHDDTPITIDGVFEDRSTQG